MIPRYTLPQMGKVWAQESRFKKLLDVEKAVAKVQGQLGLIPRKAAEQIAKKARFDVARIQEIEKTTKHDVIAFVSSVAEAVGESGRYVHYALTSSDVLDTAMSLQIAEAGELLLKRLDHLEKALKLKVRTHKKTLCAGRTHGMQAEPTSFGLKLAGYLAEILRARVRLETALKQARICKLSGAVGTYASQGLDVEKRVAKLLTLEVEAVATQVVPRDRHAEVMVALTFVMSALERLAIEIRHLQRTEVGEAEEPFEEGQKGSSAMPHKRNPIGSENITGLSRLVRSNCLAAFENIPLWHERDISHSSVERVIFPDSFILTDYAVDRMTQIVRGLKVYPKRMLANLEISQGQTMSSLLLLRLIEGGLTRESAYKIVQKHSHSLKPKENLIDRIKKDPEIKGILSAKDLSELQSGRAYFKHVEEILRRVL